MRIHNTVPDRMWLGQVVNKVVCKQKFHPKLSNISGLLSGFHELIFLVKCILDSLLRYHMAYQARIGTKSLEQTFPDRIQQNGLGYILCLIADKSEEASGH